MTDELPPQIIGSAGLTGRPLIVRDPGFEDEPDEKANRVGQTMPSNCRRVLSSPLPIERGGGCTPGCPGLQRDGSCLLDVVKAAAAVGVEWAFEIDAHDGFWDYAGDPIPGYVQVRGERPGEVTGAWLPGHEPEPVVPAAAAPPAFDCPHCGAHVVQDLENFHFWCPECGRNAND